MKMKKKLILAAALCSAAFALPAQQTAEAVKPAAAEAVKPAVSLDSLLSFLPETVAVCGNQKITKQDVIQQLSDMQVPVAELAKLPENQFKGHLKRIVENMLLGNVLQAKAAGAGFKDDVVSVTAAITKEFEAMPKEQQTMITAQKPLADIIAEIVKDPRQRKAFAIQGYMNSLFQQQLAKTTDADILNFYNENKEKEFKTPATRNVAHILIKADGKDADGKELSAEDAKKQDAEALAKAQEIKARLDKGEDFGKLAEEFSVCPSGKRNKGQLPPFGAGQMVPEFEKAAFAMTGIGTVSEPVKTMFGYHLIKLNGIGEAGYIPLDEKLKAGIKNFLAQQAIQKIITEDAAVLQKDPSYKIYGFDTAAK